MDIVVSPPGLELHKVNSETEIKKNPNPQANKHFNMNFGAKNDQKKQMPLSFGSSQPMPTPNNAPNTEQPKSAGTAQFKKKMIISKDNAVNP